MTDNFDPREFSDNAGSSGGLPCVELEFATLRRFREEMAPYLNYDGFFARSDRPLPRGTSVEFKFVMPEDFILAEGTAVVAWTIEPEANPDLVPGMTLQFVEMGKQSRAVIDELVDFHIATGGDPFDLGREVSRPGEIPTDSLSSGQGDASSMFDSVPAMTTPPAPAPEPPSSPPSTEFEVSPTPSFTDEPPGDVFPETSDLSNSDFDFKPADTPSAPAAEQSIGGSFGGGDDGFGVEIFGEEKAPETAPLVGGSTPMDDSEVKTASAHKPPRDIRLGPVVAVGIILVAVVVLVFTFFVGRDEPEEAELQPVVQETHPVDLGEEEAAGDAGSGVALVEDDPVPEAGGETAETAADMATRLAAETAAGAVAESGEEEPVEETADSAPAPASEPSQEGAAGQGVQIEKSTPPEPAGYQAASAPPAGAPATRVVDIVASARGGVTTVSIRGNGTFEESSFRSLRLEDPYRLWVGIRKIEADYKPLEIQVGSSEVDRVRIGYHPEDTPPSLYVVLDLVDDGVVLLDQSVMGDTIRFSIGRN